MTEPSYRYWSQRRPGPSGTPEHDPFGSRGHRPSAGSGRERAVGEKGRTMRHPKFVLPLAGAVGIGILASSTLVFGLAVGAHPSQTPAAGAPSQRAPATPV